MKILGSDLDGTFGHGGVFNFETNPPWKLPTPLFEEMCCVMAKMGRTIMGEE